MYDQRIIFILYIILNMTNHCSVALSFSPCESARAHVKAFRELFSSLGQFKRPSGMVTHFTLKIFLPYHLSMPWRRNRNEDLESREIRKRPFPSPAQISTWARNQCDVISGAWLSTESAMDVRVPYLNSQEKISFLQNDSSWGNKGSASLICLGLTTS